MTKWTICSRLFCAFAPLLLFASDPVRAVNGMVVAEEPLAADVGLTVLKNGGNAVDAAVAVGFALAVTYPAAGNIGGGGFMLIRLADGRTDFLDFRECAPAKATRDMYQGDDARRESLEGWKSAGVPGTVAGLERAHHRFGSKDWKSLIAPAIRLAKNGFPLSDQAAASFESKSDLLLKDRESKRIFLRNGELYKTGDVLKQPELARTLERIASHGLKGFYRGKTAKTIAGQMAIHGGLITERDLREYTVIERTPLTGTYAGYGVITVAPPSAGGIGLLQIMGMLQGTGYQSDGPDSAKAVHFEAEAMRRFYADRSEYLGDPDFYDVPSKLLLDPAYLAWRRSTIDAERATPSASIRPGLTGYSHAELLWKESKQTTHYNVVDKMGNAVAVTYTLNRSYGNGITISHLGFLLNDEMDDFATIPGAPNMFGLTGGDANAIQPRKRPVSSMTPAILTKDGELKVVIGAPGGSRIITGVAEVIFNVVDFHMNAQGAVDLPRFHLQWKPDILYLQHGFPSKAEENLRAMGYHIESTDEVGRVELIVVHKGVLEGGTEPGLNGKVAAF